MRIYSTLFATKRLDIKIKISPRNSQKQLTSDKPIIYSYHAKNGNTSLIFNPVVALTISPSRFYNDSVVVDASNTVVIPIHMVYQISHMVEKVYNSLTTDNLFTKDESGKSFMDQAIALKKTRKLSLFSSTLIVSPTLINDEFAYEPGIALYKDDFKALIGAFTHNEALAFIDMIEHMDVNTYSLLSAMVNEQYVTSEHINEMNIKLDKLEKMIEKLVIQHG